MPVLPMEAISVMQRCKEREKGSESGIRRGERGEKGEMRREGERSG